MSNNPDKIYFYRILDLVINVGTECLLLVFYKLTPRNTVASFFSSLRTQFSDLKRKGFLKDVQYQLVTASNPDPDKFDITLLSCLLTNVFPGKINKPPSGWNPSSTDTSLSADLIRMRRLRNEIAHRGNANMTKDEFNKQLTFVEEILARIANSVSTDVERDVKKKIFKIKTKEEYDNRVIAAWMRTCEEWKSNLETIQTNTDETNQVVKTLDHKMDNLAEKVQALAKDDTCVCGTDDKNVLMLQRDLISYYRKVLSKLQLSPLIKEEGYAANFLDFYVKPNILGHQMSKGQSELTPVTFNDIFSSKACQNIYISSPAGCGKTAFAKYLALIWCQAHLPVKYNNCFIEEDINEMRKFKLLLFVFLRDEHEQECDVDIIIQNQVLPNLANSTTYTKKGLEFLQKLLSSVKCIIILDGLDEWSHPSGNMCMLKNKHIPHNRARLMCTTLTTSRPWKLDVVRLKPEDIDQKLEMNGLEGDLLKQLINNVVTRMNELHGKEMKADDFKRELQDKKLTDLSKIPIVLMQLLTVWFDNVPLGESQCKIYSNMIEFLLKHYYKRDIVPVVDDIEVDDCSIDRQIPMCLQNNMYCKVHMELLSKLATLAYNTLFTDNEEISFVFDVRIAKKYLTDPEIEKSLAVGILTQEKVLGKMSIRQSHISFIHKTFQEYLAALYVALNPGTVTNVEEKIKHVCCTIEKILEMSQIFMFLSGLCPEVIVNLNEHLRQTVSEDSVTRGYRASWELGPEPWSIEGRTLLRVQDTMVEWLGECWLNGHKHVTHLPVSDFFIWQPSQWSAELKSLAVHNPVCTLSVLGDDYNPEKIEDILNSVIVFNSIQKLWLWQVSETFVVQLVSKHKHSLSVRPETWKHLGWVTLGLKEISGDILCSFVDSILPKSVQVRLKYCSISQGTKDWKAYICSHPRLTVDEDVVVDDDRRWWGIRLSKNVNLLQFHTNKV